MEYINFTAIIKEGGFERMAITPKMFGELALAIQQKGSERIQLSSSRVLDVVGILKVSKEVGDRVIMCGDYTKDSEI